MTERHPQGVRGVGRDRPSGGQQTLHHEGDIGGELAQWRALKAAASEALASAGGTITHHHAVGRTHRPWYDRERPALFADALRAVKRELDPSGVMNPGVLLDG